ncbi:hypothetical protein J7E55_12090 [Bacillus sp. ISL-53]|nr:hypothetical protein [Bacillus sp. ISL-53]
MPLYIVTYDLNDPGQKYEQLLEVLRSYTDHKHIMKSTFLIYTNETPQQIYDKANVIGLDKNDRFLAIKVTDPKQGWIPKDVWPWINERIK